MDSKNQVLLNDSVPVNGQISQLQTQNIDIDQLENDLAFEQTLLDIVPDDAVQKDDKGNPYTLPTVTTDTNCRKWFDGSKEYTPQPFEVLEDLINRFNLVKIDGEPAIYDIEQKRYLKGEEIIHSTIIRYSYHKATTNFRNEVYARCNLPGILEERKEAPANFLQFANCILDVKTMQTYKPNPAFYITKAYYPYDYNPAANSEAIDKFISRFACDRPEIIRNIHELMALIMHPVASGYIIKIYNTTRLNDGSNGKTTLCEVLGHIVTGTYNNFEGAFTTISSRDLAGRFTLANLKNSKYNFSDEDVNPTARGDREAIAKIKKKFVTGSAVTAEIKKRQQFVTYYPCCTWIEACNELGRQEHDGGTERRVWYIPALAHFTSSDPDFDANISQKLNTLENVQAMANIAVNTLHAMYEKVDFEFTPSQYNDDAKAASRLSDSSLLSWMDSCGLNRAILTYKEPILPFACITDDIFENALFNEFYANINQCSDKKMTTPASRDFDFWYRYFMVYRKTYGYGEKMSKSTFESMINDELHLFKNNQARIGDKRRAVIAFKDNNGRFSSADLKTYYDDLKPFLPPQEYAKTVEAVNAFMDAQDAPGAA